MFHLKRRDAKLVGFAALAVTAIFAPDPSSIFFADPSVRFLAAVENDGPSKQAEVRVLQSAKPPPPAGMEISCGPGQQTYSLDWADVTMDFSKDTNVVTFKSGVVATISTSTTGGALLDQWSMWSGNGVTNPIFGTQQYGKVCGLDANVDPTYPDAFITMELEFDQDLNGLYISIGDVDSTRVNSDAVRIRMYDEAMVPTPLDFAATGTIKVVSDFAYEPVPNKSVQNPGFTAALYAKARGNVRRIKLDQSAFIYSATDSNKLQRRGVFPSVDFTYCADTPQPTLAPTPPVPDSTAAPVPDPTAAPVPDPTSPPVPDTTAAPVPDSTVVPIPAPTSGGVNGDPLIIGLKGQLFKFDGRSGAWYSAISSPSFQWNMRITEYKSCPEHSDTFVSGAGFSFVHPKTKKPSRVEINVVNEFNVDIGCGEDDRASHCLGAGSLEIMIDGKKLTHGGNYDFLDGAGKVVAFNTFHQCSRKWFDFDVVPEEKKKESFLRSSRRLGVAPDVFAMIHELKDTMVDKDVCEEWLSQRQLLGDLFLQPGHHSTILIETEAITLHIQYKQENERCNAHSLDVWISQVSPSLFMEQWEGVIGETKEVILDEQPRDMYDRSQMLKFSKDEDYEVNSPFSSDCKGCWKS